MHFTYYKRAKKLILQYQNMEQVTRFEEKELDASLLDSSKESEVQQQSQIQLKSGVIINQFKKQTNIAFPTGKSQFSRMIQDGNTFVDKTLFIKSIINLSDEAILITRPRRWGKTINMSMLYQFFGTVVDQDGKALQLQPKRVLFEGGKLLLQNGQIKQAKPLKISKQKDWESKIRKYQAAYPTIFISFQQIKTISYDNVISQIQDVVSQIFYEHKYLNSIKYSLKNLENKQDKFKAKKAIISSLLSNELDLRNSIKFLTQMLQKYHKMRVLVLVDQYDTPFNYMFEEGCDINEINKTSFFITDLLSACGKGNKYLYKMIMTGIFEVLKQSGNSGFNNIIVYTITDHNFTQFFGFSEREIKEQLISPMFEERNIQVQQKLFIMVSQWYNGYTVNYRKFSIKLYNPFSVVLYLNECIQSQQIAPGKLYWSNQKLCLSLKKIFSANKIEKYFDKFFELICSFQRKKLKFHSDSDTTVSLKFQKNVQVKNIIQFDNGQITEGVLTHLLINGGYLTGLLIKNSDYTIIKAKIPNQEIFNVFCNIFQAQLNNKKYFGNNSYINIENGEEVAKIMESTINNLKNVTGHKSQIVFNSIMTCRYMLSQQPTHIVSAELHSGQGFIDNIFYPLQDKEKKTVIIHEYKYITNSEHQQKLYQDALWQICEQRYFHHPLITVKHKKHIQYIIARPLVIISDSTFNEVKMYTEKDKLYNIKQSNNIYRFFSSQPVKNLLKLQSKNRKKYQLRKILLRKINKKNIDELLQYVTNLEREELDKQIQELDRQCKQSEDMGQSSFDDQQKSKKNLEKKMYFQEILQGIKIIVGRQKWFRNSRKQGTIQKMFREKFKDIETLERASIDDLKEIRGIGDVFATRIYQKIRQMKQKNRHIKK